MSALIKKTVYQQQKKMITDHAVKNEISAVLSQREENSTIKMRS